MDSNKIIYFLKVNIEIVLSFLHLLKSTVVGDYININEDDLRFQF